MHFLTVAVEARSANSKRRLRHEANDFQLLPKHRARS
jgi:hypothetical protein